MSHQPDGELGNTKAWSGDPDEDHPDNPFLYAVSDRAMGTAISTTLSDQRSEQEDPGFVHSLEKPAPDTSQPNGAAVELGAHKLTACGALTLNSLPVPILPILELTGIVDIGYLSFLMAKNPDTYNTKDRKALCKWLIAGEPGKGQVPVRRRQYEMYKSRRRERKATLARDALAYRERVWSLRELISEDPWIWYAMHPDAEADDLVALYAITVGGRAVGIDKDFQAVDRASRNGILPNTVTFYTDLDADEFSLTNWTNGKMANYIHDLDDGSPGYWVLYQACFGDKSDSIPRLAAPGAFVTRAKQFWKDFVYLLRTTLEATPKELDVIVTRFLRGYEIEPYDLRRNLMLVLVPHPSFREIRGDPEKGTDYQEGITLGLLLQLVMSGAYWSETDTWLPFLVRLLEETLRKRKALNDMEEMDAKAFWRRK